MEISFRTKVTLNERQVNIVRGVLRSYGLIEKDASETEIQEIVKQEMVFGAIKYLCLSIIHDATALTQINNTIPKGYTKANGVD